MMAGFPASYVCIKAFSETDTTEDLKKFDVPTLILHGDDDSSAYRRRRPDVLENRLKTLMHNPQGSDQQRAVRVHQDLRPCCTSTPRVSIGQGDTVLQGLIGSKLSSPELAIPLRVETSA